MFLSFFTSLFFSRVLFGLLKPKDHLLLPLSQNTKGGESLFMGKLRWFRGMMDLVKGVTHLRSYSYTHNHIIKLLVQSNIQLYNGDIETLIYPQ